VSLVDEGEVRVLVEYIAGPATTAPTVGGEPVTWQQWQLTPIAGGRNARIVRATSEDADLVVKLMRRDRRERARREYGAMLALAGAGLEIAPRPLLLERERYETQVVVMTWLEGSVSPDLPAADDEWSRLIEHLIAIQAVTPETTGVDLLPSAYGRVSASDGVARVHRHADLIPEDDWPAGLRRLVDILHARSFAEWPSPRLTLCRSDPNIRNIVRRSGPWASVDWEASGWGDPAFEIAELISHAAYLDVPPERWAWVRAQYARLTLDFGETGAADRIENYVTVMYASWAARFARMLYEIPRGLDDRLTPWPEGWLDHVQHNYERYLERAFRALG
jgi:aminoglycoside phosphotransferase (APT) family kinase protein